MLLCGAQIAVWLLVLIAGMNHLAQLTRSSAVHLRHLGNKDRLMAPCRGIAVYVLLLRRRAQELLEKCI